MSGHLKRKYDGSQAPKFYAVRVGRQPGIFNSWQECFSSVNAFPKASYKSFATEDDARSFLIGGDGDAKTRATGHQTAWYAVRHGHAPGIYADWEAAERQIKGFHNPIYRKFSTRAEAEFFMASTHGDHAPEIPAAVLHAEPISSSMKKVKTARGRQQRTDQLGVGDIDLAKYAPGEAPLPTDTEDGFDSSIVLDEISGALRYRTEEENARQKPQAVRSVADAPIVIYTDGSTLGNGQHAAISGVGVYFGPADKRNASETLPGRKQTNQRAELTGLIRALELAPRDRKLIIKTDSRYAIQCVTTWFLGWRKNNWQTAHRKTVDNKDLVMKLIDLLEERIRINKHRTVTDTPSNGPLQHWEQGPAGVRFDWLKGHSNHKGNQAADSLAVQGAQRARELDAIAQDDIEL